MSDQTQHFFYSLLPNGKGWHWELVDTKNAVVERGIADERLRARADAFRAAFGRLQTVPKPYPRDRKWPDTFFNLINGLTVDDVDGEDFDLVADARGHALKVAQELGRHGSPLGGRSISVTDEQGIVVFKTPIHDEE